MVNKDRLAYTVYISSLSIDLYLDLDIGEIEIIEIIAKRQGRFW